MTDKILPCPFCGERSHIHAVNGPYCGNFECALHLVSGFTLDVWNKRAWHAAQAEQSVAVEDVVIPIANAYESGIGHCNDNLCNPYKEGSAEAFAYDYGKEFGKARGISQSVAVVGEPVAWLHDGDSEHRVVTAPVKAILVGAKQKNSDSYSIPLIVQPTHSITAAELDRLRKCEKDAESYRRLVAAAKAEADTHCTYPDCICPDGVSMGACNLGLPAAAIAAGEKK